MKIRIDIDIDIDIDTDIDLLPEQSSNRYLKAVY